MNWLKDNTIVPLYRKNFQRIILFYLFRCPVCKYASVNGSEGGKKLEKTRKTSSLAKTLADYGIHGGGLVSLRKRMLFAVSTKPIGYMSLETYSDSEVFNKSTIILEKKYDEYILIVKNQSKLSQTDSIFYTIRNAFAHGSFFVDDSWYYFENYHKSKYLGRIKVKEKTLLKWIELVENYS